MLLSDCRVRRLATLLTLIIAGHSWEYGFAVMPAADLLPNSTCVYVSFPDMDALQTSFRKTQLGELVEDPLMKPFAEDLVAQLRDRFGQTDLQLGLKWEDLKGVYAGEACLARVQPGNKQGEHATVLLIDVTGNKAQVDKVRAQLSQNLKQRKATESVVSIGKASVTKFQLEKKVRELRAREVYFTVVNDQLLLTNHEGLATDIIGRMDGGEENRLADHVMFKQIMKEVGDASEGTQPHVRWYADPFKYADVIQASRGARRKRRKNFTTILRNQGFDAIRALGGHVNFATDDHELLHRTFVYAPAVTDQATKFNGAARMLMFPTSNHDDLPSWLPRNLATFMSMNWNVLNGFNYSTSLIDEVVDSEGFVEDVLKSFETDKTGPQINIRTALLEHLDDRIFTFSDFEFPITTKSERLLIAIRVKDEEKVKAALAQLWSQEPNARKFEIGDHVVWEVVQEEVDLSDIELPGVGIPDTGASDEDSDEIKLPNTAMSVARGPDPKAPAYLLVATHVELMQSVLDEKRPIHETLGAAADYRHVTQLLTALGAGEDSFRFFSRTDEEYRSTYEMVKRGKMPESESMLGRVLNRLLGPEEDDQLRSPQIDGSKLPDYQVVQRYLGPAGVFVKPRDDGWFVTGVMVNKDKLVGKEAAAQANFDTATTAVKTK